MGFVENINAAATVITQTVATNIGIITPVIGNIGTVAGNMTNVNTVATNIVGLNSVVTNLAEVLLADDNAVIATTKAAEALASANAAALSYDSFASRVLIVPLRLRPQR